MKNLSGRAAPAESGDVIPSKRAAKRAAATAASASVAAKAKAKAKPKAAPAGKGNGKRTGKLPCYFFNTGAGCNKIDKTCKFDHKKLSAAEATKLAKAPGRGSRASSPACDPKFKAKAKPKACAKPQARSPSYCFKFVFAQGCNDTDCRLAHLSKDMVQEYARSQNVLNGTRKEETLRHLRWGGILRFWILILQIAAIMTIT